MLVDPDLLISLPQGVTRMITRNRMHDASYSFKPGLKLVCVFTTNASSHPRETPHACEARSAHVPLIDNDVPRGLAVSVVIKRSWRVGVRVRE
jgi:hypothetical protein